MVDRWQENPRCSPGMGTTPDLLAETADPIGYASVRTFTMRREGDSRVGGSTLGLLVILFLVQRT